jgi:hypothetical protein
LEARNRRAEGSTTLVVAWHKGAKGYEFGRVRTTQTITNQLRDIAQSVEDGIAGWQRKDYAIGDDLEEGEYMVAQISQERPNLAVPQRATPRRRGAPTTAEPAAFRRAMIAFGAMEQVGARFLREKRTAFYGILRGSSLADRVVYLRDINPMKVAQPGNILLSLGDVLSRLTETVFLMDNKIDIIIRPSEIVVINKGVFDRLFFNLSGSAGELDAAVHAALEAVPISPDTLNMLVERSRLKSRARRKILEIQESGHLQNVTIERFRAAVIAEEYDPNDFIRRDDRGGEEIFAEDNNVDTLLEILNEDLFRGDLTRRRLAASKKRELP